MITRPHSGVCIRIYIFNFKKQTNKQKKAKNKQTSKKKQKTSKQAKKKKQNTKKVKETKEEKRISPEN